MFGLDPFSRPVAIAEILLLLTLAAAIGWLLGWLALGGRIRRLRSAIAAKETQLAELRRSKPTGVATVGAAPSTPGANASVAPAPAYDGFQSDVGPPAAALSPSAVINENAPNATVVNPVAAAEVSGRSDASVEVPPILPPVPAPAVSPVDNSEAAVLDRVAARAGELNFDRIGRATAPEADDLKDISGVGPFLERKLHVLGIFTFRQIANLTGEDAARLNDIIEFFPGRIARDNWVEQARKHHERKYGRSGQ